MTSSSTSYKSESSIATYGLAEADIPDRVAANLAELTRIVMGLFPLTSLMIVGGDTALAIMRALGIRGLFPVSELLPGIPISTIPGRELKLITKSGGFGDENAIIEISRHMTHGIDSPYC